MIWVFFLVWICLKFWHIQYIGLSKFYCPNFLPCYFVIGVIFGFYFYLIQPDPALCLSLLWKLLVLGSIKMMDMELLFKVPIKFMDIILLKKKLMDIIYLFIWFILSFTPPTVLSFLFSISSIFGTVFLFSKIWAFVVYGLWIFFFSSPNLYYHIMNVS